MLKFIAVSGLFCAFLAISGVRAEDAQSEPASEQLFANYLNSDAYKAVLNLAFNAVEPEERKNGCAQLKVVQSNIYMPLQPPAFGGSGMNRIVESGAWIASPIFDQCGKQVKRRAILKVSQGKFQPIGLLPGDFQGDLTLERDSIRIVMPLLMVKVDCHDAKSLIVLNTAGTHTPEQSTWTQLWTVKACGRDVAGDVTFDKHPEGIQITAKVRDQR